MPGVRASVFYSIIVYCVMYTCRGDSLTVQKGNVCATAWMDRKVVTVMATTSQPTTGTVLRHQKDGSRIPVPCPQSIIDYNMFMGGVDRGDQVRGYYSCRTKCRKFYKYIFHFLFDVAITNSFILQKHFCQDSRHKNILDFRLQLAKELIGEYCSRRRPGRGAGVIRSLPLRHFPTTIPLDTTTKLAKHKRERCAHCRDSRVDSSWYCPECQVWLCHTGDKTVFFCGTLDICERYIYMYYHVRSAMLFTCLNVIFINIASSSIFLYASRSPRYSL